MKKLILSVYDLFHSSLNGTSTTIKEITHKIKQKTLTREEEFLSDPFFINLFYKKMMEFDKKSYNKRIIKEILHQKRWFMSGIMMSVFVSLISSLFNNDIALSIKISTAIVSGIGAFLLLFIIMDEISDNTISHRDQIINKVELSHDDYYSLSEHYNKETIKNLLAIMEKEDRFCWNSFDYIVELQEEQNGIESLNYDGNNLSTKYMKKIKRNDYAESLYIDKR